MRSVDRGRGISFAFVCLGILGVMPIIADSRPPGSDALVFALFLSLWQLGCSIPFVVWELGTGRRAIFGSGLEPARRRRVIAIIVVTGAIFGLSTYAYVLAVEKAGPVSTAIAIQAYPLFAILWESLFLNRRKTPQELAFTLLLLGAMVYLATAGTWRVEDLSIWFLLALGIPFLWSVAHVIIKEVLDRTPITPAQVTFLRVLVSSVFLGLLVIASSGDAALADIGDIDFQMWALILGLVYYLELIFWFYAVRHIDVSVASSITVPWPALTMVLAVLVLGERIETYQIVAFAIVAASMYGLLLAGARKRRA